jgi:GNAT superfamily N-acetyltransferase
MLFQDNVFFEEPYWAPYVLFGGVYVKPEHQRRGLGKSMYIVAPRLE